MDNMHPQVFIFVGGVMKSKSIFYRTASLLLIFPVVLTCSSCGKKNSATTMNLIKTEGTVGVDDAKGKSLKLIENMGLYSGYGVGTQTESYAWINFDDAKLSKLDQDSKVLIEKDGGKLEIDVQSGSMFFNITEALGEDESMDIHTSTMLVGIRGTSGWVVEDGSKSSVALLHGKAETTLSTSTGEENVTIGAMEVLNIEQEGETVSYEVQQLEDVPDFVEEELAQTSVTLFEVLGVMEEHEITEDEFWYATTNMCMDILGKTSLQVLVPYVPDGWGAPNGGIDGGMPTDFPSVNLQIGVSLASNLMDVPDSEPQVHGNYFIWIEDIPEDAFKTRYQKMYIAKNTSTPDNFGRYEAVCFALSTRKMYEEDYWIPGRHIDDEVIMQLFNTEYDMILSQLE